MFIPPVARNESERGRAPVQRESGGGGHRFGAKRWKKLFVGRAHPHFFGSKSTISRFGKRFCDGQYSWVSFLFAVFHSRRPPCPMESAPLPSTRFVLISVNFTC